MIKSGMIGGQPYIVDFWITGDDNSPLDLTGYSPHIQLRECLPAGPIIQTWETGASEILIETGHVQLTIPGSVTNTYDFPIAFMDLLLTSANDGMRSDTIQIALNEGVTK